MHATPSQLSEQWILSSSLSGDSAVQDWSATIDELLRFRNLPNDWDGEGAAPPEYELVDGAITLAQAIKEAKFDPPDRVLVSTNSTIYFEWHDEFGYREIEIFSPNDAEMRYLPNGITKPEVSLISRTPQSH